MLAQPLLPPPAPDTIVPMASSTSSAAAGAPLAFTPIPDIGGAVAAARDTFNSGRTRPLEWRRRQLKGIIRLVEENQDRIVEALSRDLHRPHFEGVLLEVRPEGLGVGGALPSLSAKPRSPGAASRR